MIGSLRHRIQVQKNYPARVQGVKSDDWRTLETIYARIEPLRGSERIYGSQKEAVNQHRITMRYRPNVGDVFEFLDGSVFQFLTGENFEFVDAASDILGRYRLKFGNKLFDIRDVQQLYPHDEFTVVRVEEVVT
jgi:hypothetical protein